MSTLTTMSPMAVSAQIRRMYDHTFRKYSSQMKGLKQLRDNKKIDKFSYMQNTEQAFAEFEASFEKDIAPLLKLLCVSFVAIFFSLQVMSSPNMMVRSQRTPTARTVRVARKGEA